MEVNWVGVSSQLEGGRFSFGARGLARNTSVLGFSGRVWGVRSCVRFSSLRHLRDDRKAHGEEDQRLNGKSNQG